MKQYMNHLLSVQTGKDSFIRTPNQLFYFRAGRKIMPRDTILLCDPCYLGAGLGCGGSETAESQDALKEIRPSRTLLLLFEQKKK